jgi:lysyl-tRNA synthetase class II
MQIEYDGQLIDFTPPWKRMTMLEAIKEYTGVDFNEIKTNRKHGRQPAIWEWNWRVITPGEK